MNILNFAVCLAFAVITTSNAQGDLDVRCYSCGYIIQPDGSMTKNGDIPFCEDFALKNSSITEAGPVSFRKYES